MKKKMSMDKKAIKRMDIIADKALGPKEQLADAAKIKAKMRRKKK